MSWREPRSLRVAGTLRVAASLTLSDWVILAGAATLLYTATLALKLVKVTRLLRVVRALAREPRREVRAVDAARVLRLVHAVAGRCVPAPGCLATALVAFVLLRRRALPARLVIGVTKARGALEGHAWVEVGAASITATAGGHLPLVVVDDDGWSPALVPGGPAA